MAIFTKEIHFKKHHFGYPSWFSGVYILYGSLALILQPLSPKKPLHCLLHDEKTSCLTGGLLGSHLGIFQTMQVRKAGDPMTFTWTAGFRRHQFLRRTSSKMTLFVRGWTRWLVIRIMGVPKNSRAAFIFSFQKTGFKGQIPL